MPPAPAGRDKITKTENPKVPTYHRHYDLSYKFASTEAFGLCNPFLSQHGVPDDKDFIVRLGHQLRTLSLNSPLLQDLKKNIDLYAVDMHAILPHNWDLIKSFPERGDDIDATQANCVVNMHLLINPIQNYAASGFLSPWSEFADFDKFMHILCWTNALFASDSLAACFRRPFHKRCGIVGERIVREFLSAMFKYYHELLNSYGNPFFLVNFLDSEGEIVYKKSYDLSVLSDRMRFFYDFEENPHFSLPQVEADSINASQSGISPSKYSELSNSGTFAVAIFELVPEIDKPINIDELIAYQLCCMQFQTNSKIDFVYSAERYRQLFEGVLSRFAIDGYTSSTFDYNANYYTYDGFSFRTFSNLIQSEFILYNEGHNGSWYEYNLALSLFTKKRSLRFIDYFVGARTSPLAVGDVNVSVVDGNVSAISMAKGTSYARLLLAASRVGAKAEDQLKGLFGSTPRVAIEDPQHLAHMDTTIYGIETQNTSNDQFSSPNSITTNLANKVSDYLFSMDITQDTILIGISTYEIHRFYNEGWSPFADKVDRYDMFNPYLQYTGDQELPMSELHAGLVGGIFGFTQKDIEYKVMSDFAVGDFTDSLRGWIFAQEDIRQSIEQNSDFIRSHRSEFDRYMLEFTGTMPEQRYHFICLYDNRIDATRAMLYNPQILF